MGLDMYAYLAKRKNENAKKVYDTSGKMSDDWYVVDNNYYYWRKNRHLHNWMEKKYLENGGEDNSFNCSFLVLTIDDFVELRNDIKNGIVEQMDSQGFFYGENDYSAHKELDLKFCNFAISELRELGDEFAVIYTSWW